MESHRTRRLGTLLVGCGVSAALLAYAIGIVLATTGAPLPEGASVLFIAKIPAALPREAIGWLSLGTLLLILTPSLRLIGMTLSLKQGGEGRAALSGVLVLVVLLSLLTTAL